VVQRYGYFFLKQIIFEKMFKNSINDCLFIFF